MNRSTWTAVLATVLVLVAATCSTYLPWDRLAPQLALAAAPGAATLRDWAAERQFVIAVWAADHMPPASLVVTAASGAVGVAAAVAASVVAWRARRKRRPLVLELARRGAAIADIARRTGLPQDAVRLLLAPQPAARTRRAAVPATPARAAARMWQDATPARPGTDFRDDPAAFAAALRRAAHGGPASD